MLESSPPRATSEKAGVDDKASSCMILIGGNTRDDVDGANGTLVGASGHDENDEAKELEDDDEGAAPKLKAPVDDDAVPNEKGTLLLLVLLDAAADVPKENIAN